MVRHKNRYLIIEINEVGKQEQSRLKLKGISLHDAIVSKVEELHGDFGVAATRAGFIAKYFNEHTRIAFIRARHGPHQLVASAVHCIKFIENKSVTVNILYVGATIKQCFVFLKKYQQKIFDEYCVTLKTDDEKIAMKRALLGFDNNLPIL